MSNKRKRDDSCASNSPDAGADESKEKKLKQRIDICEGKPTQEIIYRGWTFGVDLKVMQASCKHPIYVEDEVSKGAAKDSQWEIDVSAVDVSENYMLAFLEAVHRPLLMKKNDNFLRWAHFFCLADYFQHKDIYEFAEKKLGGEKRSVSWKHWKGLLRVLRRRQPPSKVEKMPIKEWIYCNAVSFFCRFIQATNHKPALPSAREYGKQCSEALSQLPEAVVRDIIQVVLIGGVEEPLDVARVLCKK